MISFYYIIFAWCLVRDLPSVAMGYDIYVDPNSGTNNSNCWNGEVPCGTIELGLESFQQFNQTTLWVTATPEDYVIQKLVKFEFVKMHDVAIVVKCPKSSGKSYVTIKINVRKQWGSPFTTQKISFSKVLS